MICVVSYLDDFAFFASTKTGMRQAIREFKALLKRLNLSINMSKSDFTPKRSIEYLGVQFNLKNLSLSLPESKILSVQSESKSLMTRHACSRRDLESLIGLLNFVAEYIRLGRLRLLPLIRWMNHHTSPRSRDRLVSIDDTLRTSLEVWTSRPFLSTSIPMHPPLPTMELMTDASTKGWCGVLLPHRTRELWPDYLSKRHINWLELKAVHLSLLHYQHILQGQTLLLWTDSSTALWCLRNQGSRNSDLMILTREILELCDSLDIYLIPRHLQGVLNVLADAGSRPHAIVTEWMLDRTSFERIANLPSIYPQVDLFATRDNRQMENFVSLPRPRRGGQRRISPRLEQVGVDLPVSPTSSSSEMSRQTRLLCRYRSSRNRRNSLLCRRSVHSHGTQTEMQVRPPSPSGGPQSSNAGRRSYRPAFHASCLDTVNQLYK